MTLVTQTWRSLRGARLAATVALLSLALAAGALTASITMWQSLFLRGAPGVARPRELAPIFCNLGMDPNGPLSAPDFRDLAAHLRSFSSLAASIEIPFTVSRGAFAARLSTGIVSAGYFRGLGVDLALGRSFDPAADLPGGPLTVVVSHELWRDALAGDRHLDHLALDVNGRAFHVIGVAPPGFHGHRRDSTTHLWVPLGAAAAVGSGLLTPEMTADRGSRWLYVFGRRRPEVTLTRSRAELRVASAWLTGLDAQTSEGKRLRLGGWREVALGPDYGRVERQAGFLLATTVLVMLAACANVSSLLIHRTEDRRQDWAVRVALGASRSHLTMAVVAEGAALTLAGFALGLVVRQMLLRLLAQVNPLLAAADLPVTPGALAVAFAAALLTTLLSSLLPAAHVWRRAARPPWRAHALADRSHQYLTPSSLLAVAEAALALAVLNSCLLLLGSERNELRAPLGYDPHHVAAALVDLESRPAAPAETARFYGRLALRLEALPGVQQVALARFLPLHNGAMAALATSSAAARPGAPQYDYDIVSPGYFRCLRVSLLRGRDFRISDGSARPLTMIVNAALARRLWPQSDPLGQAVRLPDPAEPPRIVIGVVSNFKHRGPRSADTPLFFLPRDDAPRSPAVARLATNLFVLVRGAGEPAALAADIRRTAHAVDPGVPLPRVVTLSADLDKLLAPDRCRAQAVALLAAVGALLSALGIYGVAATAAHRRQSEIALRLAVGSSRGSALLVLFRRSLLLTVCGLLLGLPLALLLSPLLDRQLFGLGGRDPLSLLTAFGLLLLAGCAASVRPAIRASRSDPVALLRDGG